MKISQRLSFAALAVVFASCAHAQWMVAELGGQGSIISFAYGSDGYYQVGTNQFHTGNEQAGYWQGSPFSFISLNPIGATTSRAFGTKGGFQVGEARFDGTYRAALWNMTAESFVNLDPVGSSGSTASAIANGVQVGKASFGAEVHAAYWAGTAASFVDLHPTGAVGSVAYGTDGTQHVGAVLNTGGFGTPPLHSEAALWSGTSSSWVNLHQAGAYNSQANAVQGGHQVGEMIFSTGKVASLWSGDAASWVNLHPTGATTSLANAVLDDFQVGMAVYGGSVGVTGNQIGGEAHAYLWMGSAESGIDLHQYLPGWFTSTATGISYAPNGEVWISGYGFSPNGTVEAFAIHGPNPVPEPATMVLIPAGLALLAKRRKLAQRAK